MVNKITRKYAASAQGVLYIDEGKLFIEIEDKGTYDLSKFLKDFDGKECKISLRYALKLYFFILLRLFWCVDKKVMIIVK